MVGMDGWWGASSWLFPLMMLCIYLAFHTCSSGQFQRCSHLISLSPVPFPLGLKELSMFSRLNQLARHLTRPLPNYGHHSAASISRTALPSFMADTKRLIHTAGCIIIGDEVLGGKACPQLRAHRTQYKRRNTIGQC